MKQISTGAGLVALSVGMVATAFIATHRGSGEAFAQSNVGDRRIVMLGVHQDFGGLWAHRIWSDNVIEVKYLGMGKSTWNSDNTLATMSFETHNPYLATPVWQTIEDGTPSFTPSDIDHSGHVDGGDIAQVLLNFGDPVDQTTPPPIDCTINAPR